MATTKTCIPKVLEKHKEDLLSEWMREQTASVSRQNQLIKESELREQSNNFLNLLQSATSEDNIADLNSHSWTALKETLRRHFPFTRFAGLYHCRDRHVCIVF